MALTLDATNKALEITTSVAGSVDWTASWVDVTTNSFTPGDSQGNITTATTTTIVAAPAASTQRGVKSVHIYNKNAASQTITVKKDVGGTEYSLFQATLNTGESIGWSEDSDWQTYDALGRKESSVPQITSVSGSVPTFYYKSGGAADAASYWYGFWKDTGFPGAWSPGSPGVNGRNTSGTNVADVGCLPIWTPAGKLYLERATTTLTSLGAPVLFDILWVNTGLSVTTTTGQAISMAALPARDANMQTSGEGCIIGLLFTAAGSNAATISNSTITYTNSKGTGSRTATLIANAGDMIPATPVVGTTVWFQLAAGDTGVQSIQTVTLGTSLGTGSISIIIARPLVMLPIAVANQTFETFYGQPGIRIFNDSCLHMFVKASGTAANVVNSIYMLTER